MTTKNLPLLFIVTGLLLGISWPHTGNLTFLVFFAFIPVLLAENYIYEKRLRGRRVFWLSFLMFSIFNAIATWWIYNASGVGVAMAIFITSFLMSVFFWLFHLVHRRYGNYWGYTSLVCLWLAYEYLQYHWELSWPWVNLGNIFATHTTWVQWYEYTGIAGGTLWILLANLAAYMLVKNTYIRKSGLKKNLPQLFTLIGIIFIPLVISFAIYTNYNEKKDPIDVVVVQPNINPYGDKFQNLTGEEQLIIFLRQAFLEADSLTDFIVGPETALPYSIEEGQLKQAAEVELMNRAFEKLDKTSVMIGMSSHKVFKKGAVMPKNARIYPDGNGVEFYNSALFLKPGGETSTYHKTKLVLGVEKVPFARWFPFLEKFALDLGGTSGTLGFEEIPWYTFNNTFNRARIAPGICYESIYTGHMATFITHDKANVVFVITNDGWWGDTPGYHQHFDYARLTAICLRRSVAQSANTGISGFINQKGDVLKQTDWWTQCAIRDKINLNEEVTFYAKNIDLIYRLALFLSMGFIVLYVYAFVTGRNFVAKKEV